MTQTDSNKVTEATKQRRVWVAPQLTKHESLRALTQQQRYPPNYPSDPAGLGGSPAAPRRAAWPLWIHMALLARYR